MSPTADSILRDLAIDAVDNDPKLKTGAIHKKESKNVKISDKISGLLSSPKRLLNGGKAHKVKQNGGAVRCERSVSSSNDSLEHERHVLHRSPTRQISPQRRNTAKIVTGLIVPGNYDYI